MNNKKIDLIAEKLSFSLSFLSLDLELISIDCRSKTELLGESFILNFSNKKKRTIQIIYYISENENLFLINIINEETKDTFNLINWLKKKNLLEETNYFKLSNYTGDFEIKIESFSLYIDSIFQNPDLKTIVKGEKWEKIPFDWTGIK